MSNKVEDSAIDIKSIKLLYHPNGENNLESWRSSLISYLKIKYLDLIKPLNLDSEDINGIKIPETWLQEFQFPQDYSSAPSHIAKAIDKKFDKHCDIVDRFERYKGAIVSTIVATLSKESIRKITISGKELWEKAIKDEDLVYIMKQIVLSHTFLSTGKSCSYPEQMKARQEFGSIKLKDKEDIAAFNQRFNDMVKSLKEKGIEKDYDNKAIMYSYLNPLCDYANKVIANECIDYISYLRTEEEKFPTDLIMVQQKFYSRESTINDRSRDKQSTNKFTTVNIAVDEKANNKEIVLDDDTKLVYTVVTKKSNKKSDKEKVKQGKLPTANKKANKAKENNPTVSPNNKSNDTKNPKTQVYVKNKAKQTGQSEKDIMNSLKCNKCGKERSHIAPDCKAADNSSNNQVNVVTVDDDEDLQVHHGGFYSCYDVNMIEQIKVMPNPNDEKEIKIYQGGYNSGDQKNCKKECFSHVILSKNGIEIKSEEEMAFLHSCYNSYLEKRNVNIESSTQHAVAILDGGATVHVFKDESSVCNVRPVNGRVLITGVGGIKKEIFKVGDHPIFGEVFLCPDNKYNIISESKARNDSGYYLRVNKHNTIKYLYNEELRSVIPFHIDKDNLHKASHVDLIKECRRLFPNMCSFTYNAEMYLAAAQYYTMEQQRRAQEAIALHEALNHPSDKGLYAYLQSPSNINQHISAQDLRNARDIYGPCPHCLEGKPLPNRGRSTWDPGGKPTTPGQLLHVDIVFINKKPRLFSVDHVSGYMNLILLDNKSKKQVESAMDALINHYQSSLKVVQVISTDYEEVFKSVESHLNGRGVKLALMIPYEHERVAERYMRMVREKMRVKLRELPYTLHPEFYDYLAIDCIRMSNVVPNTHSIPLTPLEMVHGEKFNFISDMTAPFGYPFLSTAHESHDPTAKNEIGISLGSIKNSKGGILTYIPGRKRLINRRCIKREPMTPQMIAHMNEFANLKPDSENPEEFLFKFQEKTEYSSKSEINHTPDFKETELEQNKENTLNMDLQLKPGDPLYQEPIQQEVTNSQEHQNKVDTNSNIVPDTIPNNIVSEPVVKDIIQDIPKLSEPQSTVIPELIKSNISPVKSPTVVKSPFKPKVVEEVDNNLRRSLRSNKGVPAEKLSNTSHSALLHVDIFTIAEYINHHSQEIHHYHEVFSADTIQIHEALKGEYSKEALEAAIKEISSLIIKIKSWRYIHSVHERTPSVHEKITPCSMFLKKKHDAQGKFTTWKARLVGGGHRTDHDVYEPFEKNSPTVPSEVAMMQLGQASYEKASVEVFDIPSAYLNAHLEPNKRQLMRFNKSIASIVCQVDPTAKQFLQKDGTILVEVLRALYGFPESAKLWNQYISGALIKGGYIQCPNEPCLFKKFNRFTNEWSVITIFVDDCLHTYKGERIRNELYTILQQAKLPNPVVQQLTLTNDVSYLGINIHLKATGELFLSQPGFINEILNLYKPTKQYKTPCTNDHFSRTKEELECQELVDMTEYLSKLMKLMFLARLTRPDILLSVVGLATRSKQPNIFDMQRLDRVIGYLLYTKHLGMNIKVTDTELNAYFDASWNCHPDAKGHSGIVITIGQFGFPIIYKSSKQKIVTRSSTEAELVCDFTGTDILLYARRLWLFLGYGNKDEPTVLHQDNTSTITISYMGRGSSGSNSKYMDLKYFWIKEYLDKNIIRMKYLPTDQMIADFFASPRTGSIFNDMRDLIMGYNNNNNSK